MHETRPTARIGSGSQKGCRLFGVLSANERRRSICRRFILCDRHGAFTCGWWQACEGDFDARGEAFFFTRFSFQGSFTKRYHGARAQNFWRFSTGSEAVPLTKDYPGDSARPMFWSGRVYFASGRDGAMNISTR